MQEVLLVAAAVAVAFVDVHAFDNVVLFLLLLVVQLWLVRNAFSTRG